MYACVYNMNGRKVKIKQKHRKVQSTCDSWLLYIKTTILKMSSQAFSFFHIPKKNKYWYVRNYLITLDCALCTATMVCHTNSLKISLFVTVVCVCARGEGANLRIRNTLSYLNKRRDVRKKIFANDFIRAG